MGGGLVTQGTPPVLRGLLAGLLRAREDTADLVGRGRGSLPSTPVTVPNPPPVAVTVPAPSPVTVSAACSGTVLGASHSRWGGVPQGVPEVDLGLRGAAHGVPESDLGLGGPPEESSERLGRGRRRSVLDEGHGGMPLAACPCACVCACACAGGTALQGSLAPSACGGTPGRGIPQLVAPDSGGVPLAPAAASATAPLVAPPSPVTVPVAAVAGTDAATVESGCTGGRLLLGSGPAAPALPLLPLLQPR